MSGRPIKRTLRAPHARETCERVDHRRRPCMLRRHVGARRVQPYGIRYDPEAGTRPEQVLQVPQCLGAQLH